MAKVVRVDELKTGDEILIKLRADSATRNKAIVLSVECWRDEITLELTCPAATTGKTGAVNIAHMTKSS